MSRIAKVRSLTAWLLRLLMDDTEENYMSVAMNIGLENLMCALGCGLDAAKTHNFYGDLLVFVSLNSLRQ